MSEIRIIGEIIGGPKDGTKLTWVGKLADGVTVADVCKMEFDGHVYKISDMDKENLRMKLLW